MMVDDCLFFFSFLSLLEHPAYLPLRNGSLAVVHLPVFLFFLFFFPVFFFKHQYISPPVEVSLKERPRKNQIRLAHLKKGAKKDFFKI
jgi:hypothetical protein